MIAGIDSAENIDVFLTPREIKALRKTRIEGILIKLQNPNEQGNIFVCIQGDRSSENSRGSIGVNLEDYFTSNNFKVSLFLSNFAFQFLKEYGKIDSRHFPKESQRKVEIYDITRITENQKIYLESLRYYEKKQSVEVS